MSKMNAYGKNIYFHNCFEGTNYNVKGLEKALYDIIDSIAEQHQIVLTGEGYAWRFKELLRKLFEKSGKVVVLIDEYDKPIIDYLHDVEPAKANRETLKEFYIVLKGAQEYLRFVFITGISRFSQVSIFSALNHLDDISMDARFSAVCGYYPYRSDRLRHFSAKSYLYFGI